MVSRQLLADPSRQGRFAEYKERHVRTDRKPHLQQLIFLKRAPKAPVQTEQNGCRIAAPSTEAGADRYLFFDKNIDPFSILHSAPAPLIQEQFGRLDGQVRFIIGDRRVGTGSVYSGTGKCYRDRIIKPHRAHEGKQVVITVRTLPDDLQKQIDFGRGEKPYAASLIWARTDDQALRLFL